MELVIIGLLGGLITGISPCILPVLPVIFLTGGAQSARTSQGSSIPQIDAIGPGGVARTGGAAVRVRSAVNPARSDAAVASVSRWRPFLVIAGLVTSFTLVTLVGSLILGALNLPQDIIRWVAMAVLVAIGLGLIVPRFEHLLERAFTWVPQRRVENNRGGFGVGLALGAVFVPCAGPVLAAIIVAGSTGQIGWGTVLLTISFAIGVAVPLLFFALAGRRVAERVKAFRRRERGLRITAGVAMIALAIGLAFNLPQTLQRLVPDYTAGIQRDLTDNESAQRALDLGGLINDENKDLDRCTNGATELESCGTAPSIKGIEEWFNTPDNDAIELEDLRGEVVLVDFWAYSCINCQRSIPHTVAWNEAYGDLGLNVIGVHSPEYAFEKDPGNVRAGAEDFGITYPVAIDNNLSTWTNYRNRYWPAHYLIDAEGTVRHIALGEGNYEATEGLIRELLRDANPDVDLPGDTDVEDVTPDVGSTTQETFLGTSKDVNYGGEGRYAPGEGTYAFPDAQPDDSFALSGDWVLETQYATPASADARVRLNFHASQVRMVLAGSGTVTVSLDGGEMRTLEVDGTPRSYGLVEAVTEGQHVLDVTLSDGVEAYSFTFG
ncbi:cytochrome c biogenesis protein DipZ [Demequina muriae]|uniref:Cytochrome c biogenesis protein DipZ n=1 Tax=Demequina muriae TaxID=3051664 RepID=A0ABT8GFT2_9MICO|nr:cytochrome c biogenesis protein DipZ [Demequina sp. EGI L300058]MDN4480285.1 cytochrome c biogenesis protein DipZ [Demequina sp. EGI L300058]